MLRGWVVTWLLSLFANMLGGDFVYLLGLVGVFLGYALFTLT